MEKTWLKNYPKGMPVEINPDEFSSIIDLFNYAVKKFRKNTALYSFGAAMTYGELDKHSRSFAAYLQQYLGLQKGERLAIMLPNSMQYVIAMLGALRAGLIVVNVNPLYTARELAYQVSDAGAKTIVVLSSFVHVVQDALSKTPLKNIIVSEIGDMLPVVKSCIINFVTKWLKKMIPEYHVQGVIHFCHLLKLGKRSKFIEMPVSGQDVAFLQYTGGTTGISKGAMLTHRNIVANVEQAYAWMANGVLNQKEEVIITALPLYHIFSLLVNCFVFLKGGIANVLITDPTNIAAFIKEMSKYRFTVFTGVNTLFKALLRHKNFKTLDFSKLKITIGGGMVVHESVAKLWYETTGNVLLEGYGLTEASPIVSCNSLTSKAYNKSIGLPLPSTNIKIINMDGEELSVGESGELCVKGPQVMLGYWNRPEETTEVLSEDGWLKTGDIAKIDEEGFLYIVDRKKDIIVVSGYNVYPNEIEAVLAEHPDVLEVAVIGEQSNKTGEVIKAYIVTKNKELDRAALMTFCRERLTTYKIPKHFEFCEELPKSNVGKILRRVLREERFRQKNIH